MKRQPIRESSVQIVMEEKIDRNFNRIFEVLICVSNILALIIVNLILKNDDINKIVIEFVVVGILTIVLLFSIESDIKLGKLLFNNEKVLKRFFISYYFFLFIACVCVFLPRSSWIFISIFIALTALSGVNTGFSASILLLTFSILLSNDTGLGLIEFLIPGFIGVVLISNVDENFNVKEPIAISLGFQFLSLVGFEILMANKVFNVSLFVVPAINILISLLFLIFVLKMVSFSFIYESQDRLLDVIDLEFELLTELKNTSKEEYDNTIFTAVLCSKMANSLGLNEALCKALGYYYHIGVVRGDNSYPTVESILIDHDIPVEVRNLLKEYLDNDTPIKSKETVLLLFADTVISSVRYLFVKDKNKDINYEKLISTIFEKKLDSGVISDSKISFEDINLMKSTLINEKLFYDFLR